MTVSTARSGPSRGLFMHAFLDPTDAEMGSSSSFGAVVYSKYSAGDDTPLCWGIETRVFLQVKPDVAALGFTVTENEKSVYDR